MSKQNVGYEGVTGPDGIGIRRIKETVKYSDFTDGGSTVGTYNLTTQIPAGSLVIGSKVDVLTAFSGDSSCTLAVGTSDDSNEYSGNTTHTVFAAATGLLATGFVSSDSGLVVETAAKTILLTATGGSDWGSVNSSGELVVAVYYFETSNLT